MSAKTWRDFSVEPIQSVWSRARESPIPEEEWDRIFAVLTAHPAHVLCDVVQTDPGACRESAVILLPGRYRVTLAGWYVRRMGTTVWDLTDPAWAAIMADSSTGETP